jgi:hypothetical protein
VCAEGVKLEYAKSAVLAVLKYGLLVPRLVAFFLINQVKLIEVKPYS